MRITNKHNLPQILYDSIAGIEHERHGDFSITELLNSPRELQLLHRHDDKLEYDISTRMPVLLGTAAHHFIAGHVGEGFIAEQTFSADVGAYRVFGTPDMVDTGSYTVWDWKVSNIYKANGDKQRWFDQVKGYAWLLRQNHVDVYTGRVVVIIRDWAEYAARTGKAPAIPFVVYEVEMDADSDQEQWIYQLVAQHVEALDLPEERLPLCSDEYRWKAPDSYRWISDNKERAHKVEGSEEALRAHIERVGPKPGSKIIKVHGEYRKCRYCLVASLCSQYANTVVEEQLVEEF
jgi:hypothetical protein